MNLSDEDLGLILEGKGAKLADGHKDRDDVICELADLLAADPRVLEGREGVALFVPQDD